MVTHEIFPTIDTFLESCGLITSNFDSKHMVIFRSRNFLFGDLPKPIYSKTNCPRLFSHLITGMYENSSPVQGEHILLLPDANENN